MARKQVAKSLGVFIGYLIAFLIFYAIVSAMKDNPFLLALAIVLLWYSVDKLQGNMDLRVKEEIRLEQRIKALEDRTNSLDWKIERVENKIGN